MISRRVYDKMRSMSQGDFFAYPMPDIYAHNVLPDFCDRILQVNDFISIYGMSGHRPALRGRAPWIKPTPGRSKASDGLLRASQTP